MVAMLLGTLLLHVAVLPYGNFAFDSATMGWWAKRLTELPLDSFYATTRLVDHLPGDLWLLWAVATLHRLVVPDGGFRDQSFLIVLKVVAILADLGIAT